MTFLDLFAGVGGFRRGMELAGHKCVGFCEWDKFAAASYTSMHLITEEQRSRLSKMDLKARQKEILKEEYKNGEWYSADVRLIRGDNVPRADCWCFGAPCQDFSIAGQRKGLDGDRSSLVREVFRVLGELEEEHRPEWLIYENVKGMLSSNRGWDFLAIILEMEQLGYDIEWELFNTKNFGVPQNRERVYTVGHLRSRGERKIFPLKGADGENSVPIKIIGHRDGYRRNTQIFAPDGVTEALSTCQGGGREHHSIVPVQFGIDYNTNGVERPIANCLKARYDAGVSNYRQDRTAVAIPVLTLDVTVYAVWYEKYNCYIAIRKLTPRECFRLQGWTDDYFEKAAFVNSDSQLYKQAGNGVTVNVVQTIGEAIKEK